MKFIGKPPHIRQYSALPEIPESYSVTSGSAKISDNYTWTG